MYRSLCWLLIACVLLLTVSFTCNIPLGSSPLATVAHAQTTVEKVSGYCERGGQKVTTAGQASTTTVQKSYPSCTVTVYQTGTSTLQTIYSNSSLAIKSNPFTADANGYFEFYSSVTQRLDVQLSGGTAPNNIATPFFWKTDLSPGSGSVVLSNLGVTLSPQRSKIDLPNPFLTATDDSTRLASSLSSKRTPTGVYNAVTDLNISADPRLYETSVNIPSGSTSVVLTGFTKETRNGIPDGVTNSVYPLRYYANSLNTWKVGQGIRIPDGVSTGVDLIATITAVSGNTLTFTPATTNANSIDFVQHDDTAAVRSWFSTYTSGTLQIPDGWIPVSSFYSYNSSNPYALSIPASSEALNQQWIIEGSAEYRSAFVMTGPGHLFKLAGTTTTNLNLRNLGLFHANRYQIQTVDLGDETGAALYLQSDQYNSEGVPQSGATAVKLDKVRGIGFKYGIISDNLQSSSINDFSCYYCNNGIFLPATSNIRGLGSQTEPNANTIRDSFFQYSTVLASNARRSITVTTAGAHNTSGVTIGTASNVITVTSGSVSSTDLYRLVKIPGASVNQTEHTALITRIISSTSFEVSQPPWISTTGLTATLYPRAFAQVYTNNANNITIDGGTWQGNWTNSNTGDELYAALYENSDQITHRSIWVEGNGGSGGAAVMASSVRGFSFLNSNVGANGTPTGYTIGLRLNNVQGAKIDEGSYIGTAGDAAADIYLENGTRGVVVDNTTLTSPQSILYGNTIDSTPDFYPPKLGLGVRYLEGTNSGPIYDAGDLYSSIYDRQILVNGNFSNGLTSWTQTAPAALTAVNTGTARGLRYIQVAPTTGGGNVYAEQLSQTVNIPDSIPENQTITLGFDFYIASRGADGIASAPTYNELRVKVIPSVGTTGQFGYNPSLAQGRIATRWERGSVTTRIGAGTGRTVKVQVECGQGVNAAVFRIANFRLTYGTKATFDQDEPITEVLGGTIRSTGTLTIAAAAGGGTRTVCVDNSGNVNTFGCGGGGGGGGLTSITAPTGGAQTGPAIAFALGTSGTDASIAGSGNTITFNFPTSSASNRGLLSASDFSMFNAKVAGSIGNTQIGVGSGTSLSGSSALTYNTATGTFAQTLNTNASILHSVTNASTGSAGSVEMGAYTSSGSLRLFATGSGYTPSGLIVANQAQLNAGSGTVDMLFALTDSGASQRQRWAIGGAEQMRLTETGLGLGTTSPSTKLHVYAASANTSGIRTERMTSATTPTGGAAVVGVDGSGNFVVAATSVVADPGANGVMVRTASNTTTARTITGTSNEITVTDGTGVSGNPTLSLASTFSVASKTSTAPMKVGTTAPATCNVGEYFMDSDATAGQNTYACTAANTWTLQGDGGGGGGSPAWDSLTNPASGNLSLSMGARTTAFTWGTTTGSSVNMFTLADGASNTGTGYVLSLNTAASSAAKPIRITAGGTSNGVEMNTSGVLTNLGTGGLDASALVTGTVSNSRLDADLAALAANSTTGFWAYTGAGTGAARTITGTINQVTVTNGNGVSGNPVLALPQDIHITATPRFSGIGLDTSAPTAGLAVVGKTINTDATGTVAAADFSASFVKNDTNTRTFPVVQIKPTLNFGGSNNNATVPILKIDTTNTATTGATVNLIEAAYGGASKFVVSSDGSLTHTGQTTATASVAAAFGSSYTNSSSNSAATTETDWLNDGGNYLRAGIRASGASTPNESFIESNGSTNGIYFNANDSGARMRWGVNNTELMRLNATGLALGTTTADGKLRLVADGNDELIKGTGYSLTSSSAVNMLDFAGTWNTTGAPTALKVNVTNTASDAASQLIDLQVGGSSKFAVRVDGAVTTGNTYIGANTFSTSTNVFSSRAEFSNFYLDAPGSFNMRIVPGTTYASADRTLTITTGDANRTLSIQGDVTLAGALTSSAAVTLGTHALTFVTSGTTIATLPSGTSTLLSADSTNTVDNKTISAASNVILLPSKANFIAGGCNVSTAGAGFDIPSTGGATAVCIGTTNTSGLLQFADAATQVATAHFRLPSDWSSSVAVDFNIIYTGDTSSTNNIRWQASCGCVADGDDLIAPSYNAASVNSFAGPATAGLRKTATLSGMAVTNCAAGETMYIKLERLGSDGADTYAGNARVLELEVTYWRSM